MTPARRIKDYRMALIVGFASAALWFFVLQRLALAGDVRNAILVALPGIFLLTTFVVHRVFRTGTVGRAFHKGAKFLMVGVMNTGIDFFVFNALIAATRLDEGLPVIAFKSLSFLCALVNSYELNRAWTFGGEAVPRRTPKEFGRFAAVTGVGFFVNVGTVAAVVGLASPGVGLSQVRWDNVAAVIATLVSLAWNFAGYSWFVFAAAPQDRRETLHPLPDVI